MSSVAFRFGLWLAAIALMGWFYVATTDPLEPQLAGSTEVLSR